MSPSSPRPSAVIWIAALLHATPALGGSNEEPACYAVDLTHTDMKKEDAAIAFGIYLQVVEPVEGMHDFPKVVDDLGNRLSQSLGGRWDIYTAGDGMISLSVPCVKYLWLTGEAWVTLLCQVPRRRLPLCTELKVHSFGTLQPALLAQQLRNRGSHDIANALENDNSTHKFEPVQVSNYRGENGVATAPSVALALRVLNETALSTTGPKLASKLRAAFIKRDRAENASGACFPDQSGRQCAWGVAVESEPEGLHQCSAQEQFDLRWPSLTMVVHRRACEGPSIDPSPSPSPSS